MSKGYTPPPKSVEDFDTPLAIFGIFNEFLTIFVSWPEGARHLLGGKGGFPEKLEFCVEDIDR